MSTTLGPRQREQLLDWMRDQTEAFTIKDIERHFDVHYMTAYNWNRALMQDGLVSKHPQRRGRSDQYVFSAGGARPTTGNLLVQRGNVRWTLADWSFAILQGTSYQDLAGAMLYLFRRSFYADAPDHQHLRGSSTPRDVRAILVQLYEDMKRDVSVLEQILSYRAPFEEGSELAQRFGDAPVGPSGRPWTMTEVGQIASAFQAKMSGEEVVEPAYTDSPPQPATIADALRAAANPVESKVVEAGHEMTDSDWDNVRSIYGEEQ